MNLKVLNALMEANGINSYFQLAKKTIIPYTTLLDLVRGKGERLSNIKIIADFFGINVSYLIGEEKLLITVDEDNNITITPFTGYNFVSVLLSQ